MSSTPSIGPSGRTTGLQAERRRDRSAHSAHIASPALPLAERAQDVHVNEVLDPRRADGGARQRWPGIGMAASWVRVRMSSLR